MTARKTSKRTTKALPPVKPCPECSGEGSVSITVLVGRRHRAVGQQSGFCLACLGSGQVPADGE